jgi:hypothetical protein
LPRRFSDAFAVQPPVVLTVSRTLLRRPSRSALRETVLGASSDSAQAGTSARRGSTTALGASRTVRPTVRTVVSALPTASVERTSSVCDAAPRAGVWTGDAHGATRRPSMRHSDVDPGRSSATANAIFGGASCATVSAGCATVVAARSCRR